MNLNCKASSVAPQTQNGESKEPKGFGEAWCLETRGSHLDVFFFSFMSLMVKKKMVWTFFG